MKNSTRALIVALVGVSLGLTAATAWSPRVISALTNDLDTQQSQIAGIAATATPDSIHLACPPGVLDPFNSSAAASSVQLWESSQGIWESESSQHLTMNSPGNSEAVSSVIAVAGNSGGELRGLVASTCMTASTDQWIVAGASAVGEDTVLYLSNPSPVPTVVRISAVGPSELFEAVEQRITVPAGATQTHIPSGWYPDLERFALHIEADGPGVAAWLQSSGLAGERPLGMTQVPGTPKAREHLIPGLPGGLTEAKVRLVATGTDTTTVTLALHSSTGVTPLEAGTVEIAGQTVLEVPLGVIPEEGAALHVTADHDVAATVIAEGAGATFASTNTSWQARSAYIPSFALTRVELPSSDTTIRAMTSVLAATPVRASAIDTREGVDQLTARYMVVNSGTKDATLTLSGSTQNVTLAAGATLLLDLPPEAGVMTSDSPVHIALMFQAHTPTGTLDAATPLGSREISAHSSQIVVDN